jgi:hypothetical protein
MVKGLFIDDVFKVNRPIEFMMQSQEQSEYLIGEDEASNVVEGATRDIEVSARPILVL